MRVRILSYRVSSALIYPFQLPYRSSIAVVHPVVSARGAPPSFTTSRRILRHEGAFNIILECHSMPFARGCIPVPAAQLRPRQPRGLLPGRLARNADHFHSFCCLQFSVKGVTEGYRQLLRRQGRFFRSASSSWHSTRSAPANQRER